MLEWNNGSLENVLWMYWAHVVNVSRARVMGVSGSGVISIIIVNDVRWCNCNSGSLIKDVWWRNWKRKILAMWTWSMHNERIVKMFRSDDWKSMNINVNELAVKMKMMYAKTKTNKSVKKFVHYFLFVVRSEIISHNIHNNHNNHNIQVFGYTIWSRRFTEERYPWCGSNLLIIMLTSSHKDNPHNANEEALTIVMLELC